MHGWESIITEKIKKECKKNYNGWCIEWYRFGWFLFDKKYYRWWYITWIYLMQWLPIGTNMWSKI